jgi:hypothetical protein
MDWDFSGWREFPQSLLDLLTGVDARWIEVPKMVMKTGRSSASMCSAASLRNERLA